MTHVPFPRKRPLTDPIHPVVINQTLIRSLVSVSLVTFVLEKRCLRLLRNRNGFYIPCITQDLGHLSDLAAFSYRRYFWWVATLKRLPFEFFIKFSSQYSSRIIRLKEFSWLKLATLGSALVDVSISVFRDEISF